MEENLRRKIMTWIEEAEGIARLQAMNQEKARSEGKNHTVEDTASLLNISPSTVSTNIKLAKALENPQLRPHLEKCKTQEEARKVVNIVQEEAAKRELARRAQSKTAATGIDKLRSDMSSVYIVGNFFKEVKKIKDSTVDLIDLDPDYGIDFISMGAQEIGRIAKMKEYKQTPQEAFPLIFAEIVKECYRILKPNGWLLTWFSMDWYSIVYEALSKTKLSTRNAPLLWIKPGKQGRVNNPEYCFTVDYEPCFISRKGEAFLAKNGPTSWYQYKTNTGERTHPCEKPVELMEAILSNFLVPGQRVCCPFAGSGNSLIAAANLGALPFGFDLSQVFKDDYVLKLQKWTPKQGVR
jgi:site-specific DNA-methyltransferase (adenine-specific)